jgi:hypothetical protein
MKERKIEDMGSGPYSTLNYLIIVKAFGINTIVLPLKGVTLFPLMVP